MIKAQRPWIGAIVLLLLALTCFATVRLLDSNEEARAQARVELVQIRVMTQDIYTALGPALTFSGASPRALSPKESAAVESAVRAIDAAILARFDTLLATPNDEVEQALVAWATVEQMLFALIDRRPLAVDGPTLYQLGALVARMTSQLQRADGAYLRAADRAGTQSMVGSALAIGSAFLGFAFAFAGAHRARLQAEVSRRVAEQLAEENGRLLAASRVEATTDALTGLSNRRRLVADLYDAFEAAIEDDPLVLALFDLDGFKRYNDTFGHPAGDVLLARLGAQLRVVHGSKDGVYRMGGDEFCILARLDGRSVEEIAEGAAAALSAEGAGFSIGCSHGAVLLPQEAESPKEALQLADRRMYQRKNSLRLSLPYEAGALIQVQVEQSPALGLHSHQVTELAERTARVLGLGDDEVEQIRIACELHDIGKTAIPDRILGKPGPLSDDEWTFMKQHTVIGERILAASPSLATAAAIVRSSHEMLDGTGYPDGLVGDDIPLAARIVAVCDSFDAMRSDRCYAPTLTVDEALVELRQGSGTQFDPDVVDAFMEAFETYRAKPAAVAA